MGKSYERILLVKKERLASLLLFDQLAKYKVHGFIGFKQLDEFINRYYRE
jgi:hypothetical protein